MSDRRVLDNWKEIAAYLGRTGKTCRNWEKEYGLPVHRLDGSPRAHVFAYADEIDRWKEELLREKPAASREITVKFSLKKLFIPAAIGLLVLAAALVIFFKTVDLIMIPRQSSSPHSKIRPATSPRRSWAGSPRTGSPKECPKLGSPKLLKRRPASQRRAPLQETERIRALAREAEAGTLVSGVYFLQGKTPELPCPGFRHVKWKIDQGFRPWSAAPSKNP